ncbi:hypothetical protein NDU88_004390 [Pleurodeles waltl]|uniref:Uncharacterized protein n=1 Tax=Pleurodeles waltl TaxID=8319 RepID=A0AAV7RLG6_PLEWA|nr:hypothetical protein NDU88_004390 [Pleurodeles waltl]
MRAQYRQPRESVFAVNEASFLTTRKQSAPALGFKYPDPTSARCLRGEHAEGRSSKSRTPFSNVWKESNSFTVSQQIKRLPKLNLLMVRLCPLNETEACDLLKVFFMEGNIDPECLEE